MKVEVTQEDIELGVRGRSHLCPISRAIQRKRGVKSASTTPWITNVVRPGRGLSTYQLPKVASEFVLAFDTNKPVEPFTFVTKLQGDIQ
ncbi:hypothetical protein SEA_KEELAN_77 [Gordonia phage Keelan]|nr:hypothetical protein SEA_KEELAN_77 [Gordonia phage Keelan]